MDEVNSLTLLAELLVQKETYFIYVFR